MWFWLSIETCAAISTPTFLCRWFHVSQFPPLHNLTVTYSCLAVSVAPTRPIWFGGLAPSSSSPSWRIFNYLRPLLSLTRWSLIFASFWTISCPWISASDCCFMFVFLPDASVACIPTISDKRRFEVIDTSVYTFSVGLYSFPFPFLSYRTDSTDSWNCNCNCNCN